MNPSDVAYTKDWDTAVVKSVNLLELDEPVEVFNFEVEDCHTYFVGDIGILVHNATCHQSREWRAEKKRYWKNEGVSYKGNARGQLSRSGNYNVTDKNLNRMLKGKAPKGIDNKWVNLHHTEGINTNMYNYTEITWTQHFSNFKDLHPWLF